MVSDALLHRLTQYYSELVYKERTNEVDLVLVINNPELILRDNPKRPSLPTGWKGRPLVNHGALTQGRPIVRYSG